MTYNGVFRKLFENKKADPEEYYKDIDAANMKTPAHVGGSNLDDVNALLPNKIDTSGEKGGFLGAGAYGSVYKTLAPKRVVKLSSNPDERILMQKMQKVRRIKDHPFTYKQRNSGEIVVPRKSRESGGVLNFIDREDLKDLEVTNTDRTPGVDHDVEKHLEALDRSLYKAFRVFNDNANKWNAKGESVKKNSQVRRVTLTHNLLKWLKGVQADPTLSDRDKRRLKSVASGAMRFIHHGIDITPDMRPANIGKRSDGQLVLRDAGIFSVLPKAPRGFKVSKHPPVWTNAANLKTLRAELKAARSADR